MHRYQSDTQRACVCVWLCVHASRCSCPQPRPLHLSICLCPFVHFLRSSICRLSTHSCLHRSVYQSAVSIHQSVHLPVHLHLVQYRCRCASVCLCACGCVGVAMVHYIPHSPIYKLPDPQTTLTTVYCSVASA